jgi:hypothetical protein
MTNTTRTPRPRRLLPTALAIAGVVVLSGTTGAVAGAQITGAQIKDGTVGSRDIKDGSISYQDTSVALDREHRRVGGYLVVRKSEVVTSGESIGALTAACPGPRHILGTTAYWANSTDVPQVEPQGDRTKQVRVYGTSSSGAPTDTASVILYCGRTTPN